MSTHLYMQTLLKIQPTNASHLQVVSCADEPRRVTTVLNILRGDMSLVGPRQRCPLSLSNTLRLNDFDSRCTRLNWLLATCADRKYASMSHWSTISITSKTRFFLDLAIVLHTILFAMRDLGQRVPVRCFIA